MKQIKIQELYLYPIKSLQSVAVDEVLFDEWGLVDDRRFMLVDQDYKFLTQRENPELAQFKVGLSNENLIIEWKNNKILVPKNIENPQLKRATVWGHQDEVIDCGLKTSDFFSDLLGYKVSLVKMASGFSRLTSTQSSKISLVDSRQILLANLKGLEWINREIEEAGGVAISFNRFRANLIIDDELFIEEKILSLQNEQISLIFEKKCGRCVVITTDQNGKGRQDTVPLKVLSKRNKENSFGVYFTANLFSPQIALKKGDCLSAKLNPLYS